MKNNYLLSFLSKLSAFFIVVSFGGCGDWSSCDSFNIDSYEIAIGIDIPKVTSVDCNSTEQFRTTIFELEDFSRTKSSYSDFQDYLSKYGFEKVPASEIPQFSGAHLFDSAKLDFENHKEIYFKSGIGKTKSWQVVVIPETRALIAEMRKLEIQ